MGLMKPVVRRITYDLYKRRDGFWPHRYRRDLHQSQYWSADAIVDLQRRRLKELLSFAYHENRYYRARFDQIGFHPDDYRDCDDLRRLPALTKEDIRTNLVNCLSTGHTPESSFARRTGGSTGTPVLVYHDFDASSCKAAAAERHNAWAGWDIGDRVAAVWGDVRAFAAWKVRLRNALTVRMSYLDTLHFDDSRLESFLNLLRRQHHSILYGHAHSIYRFAEYVIARGYELPPLKGIVTTSMVLSSSEREVIERAFDARVFDRYGCHETSIIASECDRHDGLHIFAEGVLVEIDAPRSDLPGRVLVTDLLNRAMPLIRYEVGDHAIAATGRCGCGRGLPRIREIRGRTADFLYTPDRCPVFGISVLDTFVIQIPGIRQMQISQDRYEHLHFNIVKDAAYSEDTAALLRWKVRSVFGDRMRYDVQFVDHIPQTPSGKYRFSICRIPERTQVEDSEVVAT